MKTKSPINTVISYLHLAAVLGLLLIPRLGLAASISCGQTVSNATTVATQIDQYSYTGTTGQVMTFAFWVGVGGALQEDIYNPEGQVLASVANLEAGSALNLTLTNSGTFTILVHSQGYNGTNNYAVGIQSVTGGGCDNTTVVCGQTVNSNINSRLQISAYAFGSGGGTVFFSFNGNSFGGAQFDLYDPTGNIVFSGTPGTSP